MNARDLIQQVVEGSSPRSLLESPDIKALAQKYNSHDHEEDRGRYFFFFRVESDALSFINVVAKSRNRGVSRRPTNHPGGEYEVEVGPEKTPRKSIVRAYTLWVPEKSPTKQQIILKLVVKLGGEVLSSQWDSRKRHFRMEIQALYRDRDAIESAVVDLGYPTAGEEDPSRRERS